MNKYEYIAQDISTVLGNNYDIKYYDNNPTKWADILKDDMIHGVLEVTGGQTTNASGIFIKVENLSIAMALPIELDKFSEAIQNIDDKIKEIHHKNIELNSEFIQISYVQTSNAQKITVSGTDYAMINVYLAITVYDKVILATDSSISIDNTLLKGIINFSFKTNQTADGVVLGLDSPIQQNFINGIQVSLTIDLLFVSGDDLHLRLMKEATEKNEYEISYFNGFLTRTMKLYLAQLLEAGQIGDVMKGQLIFGVKGNV